MENIENVDFEDIKQKVVQINELYDFLFRPLEDKKSLKEQIIDLQKDLVSLKSEQQDLIEKLTEYHNDTLVDYEEQDSIKTQIDNLLNNFQEKIKQLEQKQILFDNFYTQVFEGTKEEVSYQSQFKTAINAINKSLAETEDELHDLIIFYNKVIDSKSKDGKVVIGLETTVNNLKNQLQTLISNAEHKLHALTDSSLHNAFAVRADSYTKEFSRLEKYTFWSIVGLIADLLIFGGVQVALNILDKPFNYHILIYQFSIAGALILAIWMFNRNQKIAKKLAEEYHHKASISEAMTGYRNLYGLEHEDDEYMALFNSIKDQLNVNPSKQIDDFLNLKSPSEEISGIVTELLNPKNLEKLATQLKPIMDKVK